MRRLILAAGLSLAVLAVSTPRASAWCKFSFSAGFNICYESTGNCWNFCFSCVPNPPPCCYGYGYPAPVAAPAYDHGYAYGGYDHGAYAAAAPAGAYPADASAAGVQQAGYGYGAAAHYPTASGADGWYGYGAAYGPPAYWYGH
jgi:hypothetical protein